MVATKVREEKLKICEYDKVKCPLCGEEEKIIDKGKGTMNAERVMGHDMVCHIVFCRSCSIIFAIPCED